MSCCNNKGLVWVMDQYNKKYSMKRFTQDLILQVIILDFNPAFWIINPVSGNFILALVFSQAVMPFDVNALLLVASYIQTQFYDQSVCIYRQWLGSQSLLKIKQHMRIMNLISMFLVYFSHNNDYNCSRLQYNISKLSHNFVSASQLSTIILEVVQLLVTVECSMRRTAADRL